MTVNVSGVVRLTFSHRWSMEGGNWDGGQVRVSVNGGPYTAVPASAFTENGYNGTVLGNSASVVKGESAFVNNSAAYPNRVTSTCDLGSLNAGDTVSVQFLYAADTNTRGSVPNWEIDHLTLNEGGAPGLPLFIQWQRNNGAGWADIPGAMGGTYTFNAGLAITAPGSAP
jgi:hypothetical protein